MPTPPHVRSPGRVAFAAAVAMGCGRGVQPVPPGAATASAESPAPVPESPIAEPPAASPGSPTQLTLARTRAQGSTVEGPRLRVLGTAQDGGFPHASCNRERCAGARRDPRVARYISSLGLIVPETGRYLVDATPDIRDQLELMRRPDQEATMDRAPVDGVFLTHAHIGHYLGLAFFGFEAIHTRGLTTWATPAMGEFLRQHAPWQQLMALGNLKHAPVGDGEAIELGEVTVTATRVPHRNEYADTVAYGFRGPRQTVVFVPDCDPWTRWTDGAEALLKDVDVALLDATFYSADELPGRDLEKIGHPLMVDTMTWLEPRVRDGSLQVVFVHLNHSNPATVEGSPEHTNVLEHGFTVARAGDEIPL